MPAGFRRNAAPTNYWSKHGCCFGFCSPSEGEVIWTGTSLNQPFAVVPPISLQAAANAKNLLISFQTTESKAWNLPWVRDVPTLNYSSKSGLWKQSSCGSPQWLGAKESRMGAVGLATFTVRSQSVRLKGETGSLTPFGLSCGKTTEIRNFGSTLLTQAVQQGRERLSATASASAPGLPSPGPEEVQSCVLPSRKQGKWIQGMSGLTLRNGSCCWSLKFRSILSYYLSFPLTVLSTWGTHQQDDSFIVRNLSRGRLEGTYQVLLYRTLLIAV